MGIGPRPRGFALIVSLGILALASVLGVAFVTYSGQERNVARCYLDCARARLTAQAGFETAIAKLRVVALDKPYDDPADPWVYRSDDGTKVGAGTLLGAARNPSFATAAASGTSGTAGGDYLADGNTYSLKIIDCAAQIYLNCRQPAFGTLLNNLGRAIAASSGGALRDPIAGRGDAIVALRDRLGGFYSKTDLGTLLDRDDLDTLSDFVNTMAWCDPAGVVADGGATEEGLPTLKHEVRAPVNLNTAPRAVLQAVLTDLDSTSGGRIDFDTAGRIADAIIAYRQGSPADPAHPERGPGPFSSWMQFYAFVDTLTLPPIALTPIQADVVRVQANPNLLLHQINPERHIRALIDKLDLRNRTTEFCFRAMGLYEITSLGRILDGNGVPIAEATVRGIVKIYDQMCHTTQADFERRRTSTELRNTGTFPESLTDLGGAAAADYAGYIQLLSTVRPPRAGAPALTFEWQGRVGYAPGTAAGSPAVFGSKSSGVKLMQGSDLFPDGAFTNTYSREPLGWDSGGNLAVDDGSLEFWVKFDSDPNTTLCPIFAATQPFTSEIGLQSEIDGAVSGGTLYLTAVREVYTVGAKTGTDNLPTSYPWRKTTVTAVVPNKGFEGEWHHIAWAWTGGTDQRLYVDGEPVGDIVRVANDTLVPIAGTPPYEPTLWVGARATSRFGGDGVGGGGAGAPCKNLTLDDFFAYARSDLFDVPGFQPPDRFLRIDPMYVGQFSSAFPAVPYDIVIGPITWTEWIPKTRNGAPIPDLMSGIEFGLGTGDKKGGKKVDGGVLPGGLPLPVDVDVEEGNEGGGGGGGGGSGGGGGKPKTPKGSAKELLRQGFPAVILSSQEIAYTFDFVIPPTLIPLCVTPVVDDVSIMYEGPLQILLYEVPETR